jgi:formylglycine-generating enzyme required for sulfatase activity
MHFCGWLTHKFPDHEVEVNLPGELGAENHTAFAKLYRKQSVPKAILVDPDAYDNPWFKEDYQDNAVKSGDWVQHVGMSPTDATGIFDLHGNVWEWTNDVYEDERGSPSNHRLLPVLVGGGPGSVTFQNYEPADSNLQTVLRPELIGFRVIVSAFPKGSSSLKRDSKLDK